MSRPSALAMELALYVLRKHFHNDQFFGSQATARGDGVAGHAIDFTPHTFRFSADHQTRPMRAGPTRVATEFAQSDPSKGADWKVAPAEVADVVLNLLRHPARSLPSRVEIRPTKPAKK